MEGRTSPKTESALCKVEGRISLGAEDDEHVLRTTSSQPVAKRAFATQIMRHLRQRVGMQIRPAGTLLHSIEAKPRGTQIRSEK